MLHFSKNTGTILMNVAVGVITRKRPRGIARLLESISALHRAQDGAGTVRVTLIVVENDISSALSEPLSCKVPIHYVLEPKVGIPCARNRVIKEALLLDPRPEWLAFVDDDETVEPNWLQIMVAAEKFPSNSARAVRTKPRAMNRTPCHKQPKRPHSPMSRIIQAFVAPIRYARCKIHLRVIRVLGYHSRQRASSHHMMRCPFRASLRKKCVSLPPVCSSRSSN